MAASDAAVKSDSADGEAQFVTLPDCGFSRPMVMKMVGVLPQNAALEPPQPAVQRLVALLDGAPLLARPRRRKTAADSGLDASTVERQRGRTADRRRRALASHFTEPHLAAPTSIFSPPRPLRVPAEVLRVGQNPRQEGACAVMLRVR